MKAQDPYIYLGKIIFGKWKMILLHDIDFYGSIRFNQTIKTLPISEKVLAEQLYELTEHGLVTRVQYETIPLKVEYFLTEEGKELLEITDNLYIWAVRDMFESGVKIDRDAFVVHSGEKYIEPLKDILSKLPEYQHIVDNKIKKKKRTKESGRLNNPYLYLGSKISGKWRMRIIHHAAHNEILRFNQLRTHFPITEKVLAEQLRNLTNDNILERKQFETIPLRVEYRLTPSGKALEPALNKLYFWAIKRMVDLKIPVDETLLLYNPEDEYAEKLSTVLSHD